MACQTFVNFDHDRLKGVWKAQAKKCMDDSDSDLLIKRLALLSTLKSVLSPLIESAVLIDRYMKLKELGHEVYLQSLFDYTISTRNVVLVSTKTNKPRM